jgi:hypothetical protein
MRYIIVASAQTFSKVLSLNNTIYEASEGAISVSCYATRI